MKKTAGLFSPEEAQQLISQKIADLDDWRGDTLAKVRKLIKEADPEVVEEWKWGTPVWSHDGIVCTGESYKAAVKLTFPKGASLKDPKKLFNASLEGNARRAIDFKEGEKIDGAALKALFLEAIAANVGKKGAAKKVAVKKTVTKGAVTKKVTPTKKRAAK